MANEDKWVQLVSKLNELTQEKKLIWQGPEAGRFTSGRTFRDFYAKYKDKGFRIRDSQPYASRPRKVSLDIVDGVDAENILFTIPDVVGIADLCDSIIYQRAGIKDLLDDLMKE